MAAVLIFRSCLQWKVFQADRTVLFDKIINTMGSQIERQQDNNACLSYWLSNTVTLLYLLQRNIKPASGGSYNSRLRSVSPTVLLLTPALQEIVWLVVKCYTLTTNVQLITIRKGAPTGHVHSTWDKSRLALQYRRNCLSVSGMVCVVWPVEGQHK